jgi:beta-fructofuranosidase
MNSPRRDFLRTLAASSTLACARALPLFAQLLPASRIAQDPLRPQFHLLPVRNWMNDPNGPICWNGNYHMFFQHNPNAAVWGDMHWAHAVSPDMIHWRHLPVALAPTPGGPDQDGCFSGSAVIRDGVPTFLYTAVKSVAPENATLRDGTHNFLEAQCLATSRDPDLKTLNKLDAPVLLPPHDPELTGFRDPCLWSDQDNWFMGIGSGRRGKGGQVLLYRSRDLHNWEYIHPLSSGKSNGKQTPDSVDSAEMWECPDFFPLGNLHVLLYSTERKVFWQVGEYDRKELLFHPEKQGFLDVNSYYAPKSQLDATGRRILWGWIPETRPEAEFRAAGWAGCMSVPRVLSVGWNHSLNMSFLPELSDLREKEFSLPPSTEPPEVRGRSLQSFAIADSCCEIELHTRRAAFEFSVISEAGGLFSLSFNPANFGSELTIAGKALAVLPAATDQHYFHIYLDASVLECVVDDTAAVTARVYTAPKGRLRIRVSDHDLQQFSALKIWELNPISKDRLTS